MRAEAESFRAQETGVHIPHPVSGRLEKNGGHGVSSGIGTRASEHETILPQRGVGLIAKGRARALPSGRLCLPFSERERATEEG